MRYRNPILPQLGIWTPMSVQDELDNTCVVRNQHVSLLQTPCPLAVVESGCPGA